MSKETIQRLCDNVDALMSEKLHTRITKLEDKGVEQVIVDTIGPMLERITDLEERNIGYKQDIVLLSQENSQMFERIVALEEQHTRLHARFVHHKEDHFKEPAEPTHEEQFMTAPIDDAGYIDFSKPAEQLIHEEQLQPVNNDYSSPRTEDKIYANPHKDKISATSDKPEPAMEEWIEVDGKMYSRTEAAGRIEALEKELRYLQTAGQAKIYNGPS